MDKSLTDRPRYYTRLRYGDHLFFFFETVDLDKATENHQSRIMYADVVIDKRTDSMVKCRYILEDIFELALLSYREKDPVIVRSPK